MRSYTTNRLVVLNVHCLSGPGEENMDEITVSDADREIPTRRYTDNAGKEVNRWPEGWDIRSASETDD